MTHTPEHNIMKKINDTFNFDPDWIVIREAIQKSVPQASFVNTCAELLHTHRMSRVPIPGDFVNAARATLDRSRYDNSESQDDKVYMARIYRLVQRGDRINEIFVEEGSYEEMTHKAQGQDDLIIRARQSGAFEPTPLDYNDPKTLSDIAKGYRVIHGARRLAEHGIDVDNLTPEDCKRVPQLARDGKLKVVGKFASAF